MILKNYLFSLFIKEENLKNSPLAHTLDVYPPQTPVFKIYWACLHCAIAAHAPLPLQGRYLHQWLRLNVSTEPYIVYLC